EELPPRVAAVRAEREHDHHRHPGRPRDPQRERVHLLGQRRLLAGRRLEHVGDPSDLGASAGRRHDHCPAAVRHRRVHEGHVGLVATGALSPVRADSSIWSELAEIRRPSAGTWSPAASRTTSPTTSWSAGIAASVPSRRTRAVSFIIDRRAFIALSALPSWRRPTTAFRSVIATRITAVLHSVMTSEMT